MGDQVDYDVCVIGGGPGGSACAGYLAQAGLKVCLFEREIFPRPHVGESLVPSSTRVFRELNFLEKMERSGFPKKYGAVWTASSKSPIYQHDWEGLEAGAHADIQFRERAQPGVPLEYTWHVDRGRFDLMLLQHAQELGAEVIQGVRVAGVDFSDVSRPEVRLQLGHKEPKVSCRLVVDATGRKTLLGSQLGLRIRDDVFDQYALHTWFENFDREAATSKKGQENYIYVHFLPISNSWIWQIPISETTTSIGVVTQRKNFAKTREDREAFFWECISTRPELYAALKAANQLRPLTEEGDYSYAMREICGDGFVLVGDAARFVDPIFSTGVSIALNSARFASRDIIAAAQEGSFTKDKFATFERTMRLGTDNWYAFISVYYRLNVLFTAFIQDPRYRLDVLKLLQGDVYDDGEPEVLVKMRKIVSEVEDNPEHVWHRSLGDLTSLAFKPSFGKHQATV